MFKDIIKMALKSLLSNKMRSFLSVLGIIIGVSTISLVIAIGLGAQKDIEDQFKNLSVTAIAINPISTEGTISKLSIDDVAFIKANSNYIESVTAYLNGKLEGSYGSNSNQVGVLGVTPDIFTLSNLELLSGEYFGEEDIKNREKVAVLGSSIIDDLFDGNTDIIGEIITIGRKKIKVVGILKQTGGSVGPVNFDDNIYMPFTSAESILGTSGLVRMTALANDIDSIYLAMDELTTILREAHKLKSNMADDFRLKDQGTKVSSAQDSTATMNLLLILIATIVLIVSGIGIMNVMFAGVAERTREIGILKSIGAKRSDILKQFLIESIVLAVIGGIIGVLLGELIIPIINTYTDMSTIRSNTGMLLAFIFSVIIGVFFGYYPAYKASKLDPVDALRS